MVNVIPGIQRFQEANPAGLVFAQTLDTVMERGCSWLVTTLVANTGVTTTDHGKLFKLAGFNLVLDPAATLQNGWYCVAVGPGLVNANDGTDVYLMADEWALVSSSGSATTILKSMRSNALITKIVDESIASDATLSDDALLKFPVLASTKYWFRGKVWFNSGATPDFKFDFNGPATPTRVRLKYRYFTGESATTETIVAAQTAFAHTAVAIACDGTDGLLNFDGYLHNGANAGTVAFRWSQNTVDVGATLVRASSYIEFAVAQ